MTKKRTASRAKAATKKKPKFSKVVVVAVLISVLIFTIAMAVTYWVTGGVPDSLVTAFFVFAGGEAGVLGFIRYGDAKYPNTQEADSTVADDEEAVG